MGVVNAEKEGKLVLENAAIQYMLPNNATVKSRLSHLDLGSNHANRILNEAIDDVTIAINKTKQVINFIKNRKENIDKGKQIVKDKIKDIYERRKVELSNKKTRNTIIIILSIIIVHIIIRWSCSIIGISFILGWAITIATGGLGLFYLIYKALREKKYDREMKKDPNYYDDIDFCGDLDSNYDNMYYNNTDYSY